MQKKIPSFYFKVNIYILLDYMANFIFFFFFYLQKYKRYKIIQVSMTFWKEKKIIAYCKLFFL